MNRGKENNSSAQERSGSFSKEIREGGEEINRQSGFSKYEKGEKKRWEIAPSGRKKKNHQCENERGET